MKVLSNSSEEEQQLKAVRELAYNIIDIANPSEKVQLAAIETAPYIIEYIDAPSEEIMMYAVQCDAHSLAFMKSPSEKVKESAIKSDATLIEFIQNPSLYLQELAISGAENMWTVLYCIPNLDISIQIRLVAEDKRYFRYIKNPSPEVVSMNTLLWET